MGPIVSRVWVNAKQQISSTKAKPLVCNFIVRKMEAAFDTLHEKLLSTSISKNLRPVVATAWQYAKVEMVPPMTSQMFQGSLGKSIETTVGGVADKFIGGLEQKLNDIEAARILAIKQKEAALKAAAEKAKAEALKKAEEEKRLEAAKAKEAAKQAKAKEAAKEAKTKEAAKQAKTKEAAQPAKKVDPPKKETKSEVKAATKKPQKRVPPKTKKKAKTTRRKVKKGSPPKAKK
ncbi:unnamed protein product [Pieris brassicae]|uniref:Uncharacterized protein n=1 Tax=Pieris brassicae TaxID=7116 RepID=A0A9P0X8R0_PIEBR|nr:unnamed protein product [Pieris brassicae]